MKINKPIIIGSLALSHAVSADHELYPMIQSRISTSKDRDLVFRNRESFDAYMRGFGKSYFEDYTLYYELTHDIKFSVHKMVYKKEDRYIEVSICLDNKSTTAKLFDYLYKMNETIVGYYPTMDMLYTIKLSHRFIKNSPHFRKTMYDILLMRKFDVKVFDNDWYKQRIKETYDYSHPKLNVKSKDFFTSNVNYIYDHDSIHEAIAALDIPAYRFYMSDGAEVNCSKETFMAQSKAIRILGVLEETYVLALERSQIPNNFNIDPRLSFDIALEKVCTSITSGWFREYAWENYHIVSNMYDENYVQKFKDGLKSGIVKPYKK